MSKTYKRRVFRASKGQALARLRQTIRDGMVVSAYGTSPRKAFMIQEEERKHVKHRKPRGSR